MFDTSLAEQGAPEGQTYLMKCRAQGQSQPRIIWKVDQRNAQRKFFLLKRIAKQNAFKRIIKYKRKSQ